MSHQSSLRRPFAVTLGLTAGVLLTVAAAAAPSFRAFEPEDPLLSDEWNDILSDITNAFDDVEQDVAALMTDLSGLQSDSAAITTRVSTLEKDVDALPAPTNVRWVGRNYPATATNSELSVHCDKDEVVVAGGCWNDAGHNIYRSYPKQSRSGDADYTSWTCAFDYGSGDPAFNATVWASCALDLGAN